MKRIIQIETKRREPGFFRSDAIIEVEGADRSFGPGGFSVGGWDATAEARVENGGPKVHGPHAYIIGLCSVIDTRGGTGAINDQAKSEGRYFETKPGDELIIDGYTYTVKLDGQRHPQLISEVAS